MAKTGPKVDRRTLIVLGKYLDDALTRAHMSRAELARRAGIKPPHITRIFKGKGTVSRETLLKWCTILACPDWLEERILNAAGYASREQMQQASDETVVEETHKRILRELQHPHEE